MNAETWKMVLEIASPATIIFVAGGLIAEFKRFREDISDLKPLLQEWKSIVTRLGMVESATSKLASEHRELRAKVGDTAEGLAEARGKLESLHEAGE